VPTYTVRVEKFVQYAFEIEVDADSAEDAMDDALEQAHLDPELFEKEDAESDPRVFSVLNQENDAEIALPDILDNVSIESCLSNFGAKVGFAVEMAPPQFGPDYE